MNNQSINYIFNITGNANDVVNNITQNAGTLNKTLSQTLNVFSGFRGTAVALQGISSMVQNVQSAIGSITQVGANAELQLMNMKTLFQGNSEAATDMYKRISEYGKVTPYDKAGLIDAQKTMMSFGIEGEKAFTTLKQIGDIAMGDSQKMQSLTLAFAQMSSTGKLQGQDLLQMINAGFNPLTELSKQTGKTVVELKEAMSKGAISVKMVEQAFASATSEGGLFYKAIDEASQTTAGKMAAIQDTIDEIKVSIFNATGNFGLWVDAAAKMAVPLAQLTPIFTGIGTSIKWISGNWTKVKNNIRTVRTHLLSLLPTTFSVAAGFKVMGTMAKSACRGISAAIMNIPIVGWIAAGITAVIAAVTMLWQKSEGFRRVVMGMWEVVKAVFQNVWTVIKIVSSGIWEFVKGIFGNIKAGFVAVGDFFISVWTWISDTAIQAFDWIGSKLDVVGMWIKEKLVNPIKNAFTGIWTVIKDVFNKILGGLGKLFEPIKKLWNKIFPKDQFKDIGDAYQIGAEKGSESWRKSKRQDEVDTADTSILGSEGKRTVGLSTDKNLSGGNLGSSAGASAGKAQQINIKLGSMVGTMNFNGGMRENAHDMEATLKEMMARILGMAETIA